MDLVNSPIDWLPKTLVYCLANSIQYALYTISFGRNGANIHLEEVPLYIIIFTLVVGAALRKLEMMQR